MPFKPITWKDRRVEFPNRFKLTSNPDGTVDLEEQPGIVESEGTPISAGHMNRLEEGIMEAYTAIQNIRSMVPLTKTASAGHSARPPGTILPSISNWPIAEMYEDKIYVICGTTIFIYDITSRQQQIIDTAYIYAAYSSAVLIGDAIYRTGGVDQGKTSANGKILAYNIPNNTWETIAETGWDRYAHSSVKYMDDIYGFGGFGGSTQSPVAQSDVIKYSLTFKGYSFISNATTAYGHTAAAIHDCTVYLFGGQNSLNWSGNGHNVFQTYNIELNTWQNVSNVMPTGRAYATALDYNGKIYIIGQYTTPTAFFYYNITTGTWTTCSDAGVLCSYHSVAVLHGDMIYHMAGSKGNVYNIVTDTWSTLWRTSWPSGYLAGYAYAGDVVYITNGGFCGDYGYDYQDVQYIPPGQESVIQRDGRLYFSTQDDFGYIRRGSNE